MFRMFLKTLCFFSLLVLSGCAFSNGCLEQGSNDVVKEDLSVQEILVIAKKEIEKMDYEYIDSRTVVLWSAEGWRVVFIDPSLKIGSEVFIAISHEGKIVKISGGD